MTYFGFLVQFLVVPIILLAGLTWLDWRQGRRLPAALRGWPAWLVVLVHVIVALVYTTPWDNYLVASGVWTYNPNLVAGIVIGWVPLEEYTFFILQPILAGLWLLWLARRLEPGLPPREGGQTLGRYLAPIRWTLLLILGLAWLAMAASLIAGWAPGTYMALILAWALPPIMLQIGFGLDILWRQRRLVAAALVPVVTYLCLADALAINSGTWTIDPAQSLQIYLGGVLPLEEFLFFLVTTMLLVFGIVLVLAQESQERVGPALREKLAWLAGRANQVTPSSDYSIKYKEQQC